MENSLKLRGRASADEKQTLGKKILTAVFVVIINYFFSKFFIFKKGGKAQAPAGPEPEDSSDHA